MTRFYLTNAVKHFRHEQRGKKRIHRKPTLAHLRACAPWIHREIEIVRPFILGLMGSTASRAILGVDVRVMEERGQVRPTPLGPRAVITIHPSAVLRLRDSAERESAFQGFVTDLRTTFAESRRMPA